MVVVVETAVSVMEASAEVAKSASSAISMGTSHVSAKRTRIFATDAMVSDILQKTVNK